MNKLVLSLSILVLMVVLTSSLDPAFAHPHSGQILINGHTHTPQTEIVPLSKMIGIEKTTILFDSDSDNTLPWAFVEGKVANHVEGYPVIIQIFKGGGDDAVHFAQTNVSSDGNYKYKFRVLNSDNGITTRIFDGQYLVKIFKVVYTSEENLI